MLNDIISIRMLNLWYRFFSSTSTLMKRITFVFSSSLLSRLKTAQRTVTFSWVMTCRSTDQTQVTSLLTVFAASCRAFVMGLDRYLKISLNITWISCDFSDNKISDCFLHASWYFGTLDSRMYIQCFSIAISNVLRLFAFPGSQRQSSLYIINMMRHMPWALH